MKNRDVERLALHGKYVADALNGSFGCAIKPIPWCSAIDKGIRKMTFGKGSDTHISPTMEPMLTITPLFRVAMSGMTTFAMRRTA